MWLYGEVQVTEETLGDRKATKGWFPLKCVSINEPTSTTSKKDD